MTDIFQTKSRLFSEKAFRTITQKSIDNADIEALSDDTTMCFYIPLSDEIVREYKRWADSVHAGDIDETTVMCEYWSDKDECHYLLSEKDTGDLIAATIDFSCRYLDDMVRVKYQKQYANKV